MRFYADEKYYAVREALLALGWELIEDPNQNCDLLWTNLKSISFPRQSYQMVNHFPGSQVFSNKVGALWFVGLFKLWHKIIFFS